MNPLLMLAALLQGANLDADAGFKRDLFPNAWSRVSVTLAYEGDPLEADLRITPRTHFFEPVVYRRPIHLVRKQQMRLGYDLYFTGQEYQLDVELVAGDKVLRTASLSLNFVRMQGGRLVVVGTPPPLIVEAMAKRPPINLVRLAPDLLPPTPLSLQCVDAILIPEPIDLDPGQESALQTWVKQGGKLIFGAGRSTLLRLNPFWRDLCPLGTPQFATASLRAKETDLAVTVVRGELRRGVATLQVGSDPLVIRAREGNGEVLFMPVILDQPNLARVTHAPSVLAEIMDIPPPPPEPVLLKPKRGLSFPPEWRDRDSKAGIPMETEEFMRRLLPSDFTVKRGSLGLGIGLVALYIALIGPVEYLRLRRKGRLKIGWRSFTVLVVLFGGLILLWGEFVIPRMSRSVLVTLSDDQGVHTFSAFRPLRGGVYSFESAGAVSPLAPSRIQGAADPPELVTVKFPAAVELPVPPGATRLVVSSRPVEASDGTLQVRWASPQKDAVEVKNPASHSLNECWLVSKEGVRRLRDIPAGFDGTVPLDPPQKFGTWAGQQRKGPEPMWWMEDSSSWNRMDASRFGLVLTFHAAINEAWNAGRSRRGLEMRGLDWSPLLERGESVLIGSFDRNLSGIRPQPEIPAAIFGWARARVREASR
jgi:hypothetical protein